MAHNDHNAMGRHYSESELVSFHQQQMDSTQQEQVRVHVMDCDSCLATYRLVREFFAPAEAPKHTELEGEWQALRSRWQQSEDAQVSPPEANREPVTRGLWPSGWLLPRLAWALIALLALGFGGWFAFRNTNSETVQIAQQAMPLPTPTVTVQRTPDVVPTAVPTATVPERVPPVNEVMVRDLPRRAADERGTRSSGQTGIRTLAEMKYLWIQVVGNSEAQAFLTEKLQAGLGSQPQFSLISNANEADTKLEVSVESVRDSQAKTARQRVVTVRLVNVEGNVIWPRNTNGRQYRGLLPDITQKVLQDLQLAVGQK